MHIIQKQLTLVEADVLARFFAALHRISLRDIASPDPIIRQSGLDLAELHGRLKERALPGAYTAATNPLYEFAVSYPDGLAARDALMERLDAVAERVQ